MGPLPHLRQPYQMFLSRNFFQLHHALAAAATATPLDDDDDLRKLRPPPTSE